MGVAASKSPHPGIWSPPSLMAHTPKEKLVSGDAPPKCPLPLPSSPLVSFPFWEKGLAKRSGAQRSPAGEGGRAFSSAGNRAIGATSCVSFAKEGPRISQQNVIRLLQLPEGNS